MNKSRKIPEAKQTTLGKYVTSSEAYDMWKADPDKTSVLDVRTPEEYIFVGHAAMARNIPLVFIKYQWNTEKNIPVMVPNPDFIGEAKRFSNQRQDLRDMPFRRPKCDGRKCSSQSRFQNVYNITDGFEGDLVKDPANVFNGKRMINGWKNSAPWTYDANPGLLWIANN
ncbi:MAG: sulfurtransferase [Acidobacteria bacterium]|nr:sulfurtransferase [Acidobacteriota bacterium]